MTIHHLTGHATLRLAQRALSGDDLELAMIIGTEVEGGYLVLQRDCNAAAQWLTQLADRVRRMAGVRIVSEGRTVVTAYHTTRRKRQRLLRAAEDRNLEG